MKFLIKLRRKRKILDVPEGWTCHQEPKNQPHALGVDITHRHPLVYQLPPFSFSFSFLYVSIDGVISSSRVSPGRPLSDYVKPGLTKSIDTIACRPIAPVESTQVTCLCNHLSSIGATGRFDPIRVRPFNCISGRSWIRTTNFVVSMETQKNPT